MRTPQDWLAEQVTARPDDFAPDEMAAPLAWIASVQADARKDLLVVTDEMIEQARKAFLAAFDIHSPDQLGTQLRAAFAAAFAARLTR